MKADIRKISTSAMLAALVCIATMIVKIPSPIKGYLNLGDCVVLLSGWLLSPLYGFLAAGIGSALADIFAGYAVYAPATFVIKGLMALAAYYIYKWTNGKAGSTPARIISGLLAELIMASGYYLFEGIMYGFIPSAINIPANLVQGAVGLVIGIVLIKLLEKSKIRL